MGDRRLEIGPGNAPLEGFEGFDIIKRKGVQHVGKAHAMPFADDTFAEVYSCHCIEHVEWHLVHHAIAEWARVTKPGGIVEIQTVNATPFLRALLEYELNGSTTLGTAGWKEELHRHHPALYPQARLLCYPKKGDGGAHMHRAIITPRLLREMMEEAGLIDIEEGLIPRGRLKHKAVNMGMRGRKPSA